MVAAVAAGQLSSKMGLELILNFTGVAQGTGVVVNDSTLSLISTQVTMGGRQP